MGLRIDRFHVAVRTALSTSVATASLALAGVLVCAATTTAWCEDGPAAALEDHAPRELVLPARELGIPTSGEFDATVHVVHRAVDAPGGTAVTDAIRAERLPDGRVVVQSPGRIVRWWARVADRWFRGEPSVLADSQMPAVRHVFAGQAALVRVLDAEGRPAVGVELVTGLLRSAGRHTVGTAVSDEDGVALVRHPLEDSDRLWHATFPGTASVSANLPVVPSVMFPLPAANSRPVEFRLPPLARVEVQVDAGDETCPPATVLLRPVAEWSQHTGVIGYAREVVRNGRAAFPWVGAGQRVVLSLESSRVSTAAEIDIPAAPAAPTVVKLRLGPMPCTFVGRVVDARGAPTPGALVELEPRGGGPPAPPFSLAAKCDGDGRFTITACVDPASLRCPELVVFVRNLEAARRDGRAVAPGRVVDLGDIAIAPRPDAAFPVFVAGRVVGGDGRAVGGVTVTATRVRGGDRTTSGLGFARAAEDGSFEVRGPWAPGDACTLRVWEHRATHGAMAKSVPAGTTDAVIQVFPTSNLRVSVRVAEGLRLGGVSQWFHLLGEPARHHEMWGGRPAVVAGVDDESGDLTFGSLARGAGSILVTPPGRPDHVIFERKVEVAENGVNDRVVLDLTSVVGVRTIRVLDAEGRGAPDGAIWWRPSDASEGAAWEALACSFDGTACIPAFGAVDLLARRPGSSFVGARRVTTDLSLTPRPAFPPTRLTVELAPDASAPEGRFSLVARLELADSSTGMAHSARFTDPRNAQLRGSFARGARRTELNVFEPGVWSVGLALVRHDDHGNGVELPIYARATGSVEILGDGKPLRVVVPLPAEALADAIRQFSFE